MFGKYNVFFSKARVSACMYFLVQLFTTGEVITREYSPRGSRGEYLSYSNH